MEIELLHTKECHIWKEALKVLKETLAENGIDADIKLTEVTSEAQANQCKFSGSPQININNKDVDPMAEQITRYMLSGCRQYFYQGKRFEFPPKEMIMAALRKAD